MNVTTTKIFLAKPAKSELLGFLRTEPSNSTSKWSVTIVDFMAEARKIESWRKSGKVTTFGDCVMEIWNSCVKTVKTERIDFVFDLYASDSIKSLERKRRAASDEPIRTVITHMDQILPVASEFKKFWASSENKIALQQFG